MLHIAHALAQQGRNGDDALLHVSRNELAQLDQAAKARGLAGLPHNPKTGLPEASFLNDVEKGAGNYMSGMGNAMGFGGVGDLLSGKGINTAYADTAKGMGNAVEAPFTGSGDNADAQGIGNTALGVAAVLATIYSGGATAGAATPATSGAGASMVDPAAQAASGAAWSPDAALSAAPSPAPITEMPLASSPNFAPPAVDNGMVIGGPSGTPMGAADGPLASPAAQTAGTTGTSAANAAGGSTPWTKTDYLLAASLAGPAYGAIDSATNGNKNNGPSVHHNRALYLKPGAKYYSSNPSDYGTKTVDQTYAQGGIMGLASGGKTSENIAGGNGTQDPNKTSSNLATSSTSSTSPSLPYDPKTMPAGAQGLSGAALQYYLDGMSVYKPLTDTAAADAAAAAAADASHQNGNGGVMGEWDNALSRWMGANNSSGLIGGIGDTLGIGGGGGGMFSSSNSDPFSGGGVHFAQGGPVNPGGITALPPHYIQGAGDGMSDSIPARIDPTGNRRAEPIRVANNEYVIPADAVSHLGNGSSDAGAKVLDKMVKGIRTARTGTTKQAPQINANKYLPT